MSEMSYLEKLLDGVEVEWKTLEDISIKISSGGTPKTGVSEFYDGDIPWLRTQEVNFCDIWDTEVKITESGVKNSSAKWIPKNCVIVAMYGATVGKIGINKIPMTTNQACANIQLNEEVAHYRYVFHFLCSQYTYIKSLGTGSQTNINAQIVKNIKIPIPCPDNPEKSLAIQSEIVRILDTFTALTAELSAELNMRKKQYNYYRDQLLSFKEGEVEWKTLGEIGHFTRGKRFVKTDMLSEGYPCIHYGEMYTYYNVWTNKTKSFVSQELASKLRVSEYGDVIIVAAGETIEDIGKGTAWLGKSNVVFHDACFSYRCLLNPKYIAYFTRTKIFHDQIKKHISSGKISAINANGLSKVKIPMLSAKEQARIVEILDKFDTLTNSITEGLPREIELRQKQYEYYRDLLFSFPKPETISN
ncbi:TPA: restriction endonuclease subunit S [Escherichia coli]|uniref:restriction endonuclease subunit S n=1 Tax=Escherichia coli TaxID=562 RepID=UPI000DA50DF0|nr:restriction endonuclease subunit S [Escherichia coli]EFB3770696.1 restriction endonuclease subunit S [Escherichia coli]EFD1773425.1 restriction endonuclease subunit S [Escherichia coli]EFO1327175.1 restriction endonuclease subunit S [Escherichia coli]EHW5159439.1 restriction endonuclease subunit S [Escherichia coli]EJE3094622.1 restriction endonuclease subunit S [Escherichia coli]